MLRGQGRKSLGGRSISLAEEKKETRIPKKELTGHQLSWSGEGTK